VFHPQLTLGGGGASYPGQGLRFPRRCRTFSMPTHKSSGRKIKGGVGQSLGNALRGERFQNAANKIHRCVLALVCLNGLLFQPAVTVTDMLLESGD